MAGWIKFALTLVLTTVVATPVGVTVYAAMTGNVIVAAWAAAVAAAACVGVWNPLERDDG